MVRSAPAVRDSGPEEESDELTVHLFPGQGDFTLSSLLAEIWCNPLLRDEVGSVFEHVDPVGAEFGLRPIGPRLLGTDEASEGSDVSTGALAAEDPGTLQLALFGACLAVHRTLVEVGYPAQRILAVSFGEIPALTAAGACSVEDGARLACRLGQLLGRRRGGLTLLRAGERRTRELLSVALADVAGDVDSVGLIGNGNGSTGGGSTVIACVNDDDETVVSGPSYELARVEELAGRVGIGAQRLRLPFPGHHPMLWHEAGEFAHFARSLRLVSPRIPVYSAVAGRAYTTSSGTDLPRALGACLVHPAVLPSVLRRATADSQLAFEVGTGDALARSVRRSIPALTVRAPVAERAFPRFRNAEAAGRAPAGVARPGRPNAVLRPVRTSPSAKGSRTR